MNSYLFDKVDQEKLAIIRPFLDEYPVKIGAMAKALGLKVLRSTLSPRISGQISPSENAESGFEIKVNRYDVDERQRFTIAHEIGHYLLHRHLIGSGIVDNVMYRSNLSNKLEAEANKLAADLIMPRSLLRKRISHMQGLPSNELAEAMAEEFMVSLPAMEIRMGLR